MNLHRPVNSRLQPPNGDLGKPAGGDIRQLEAGRTAVRVALSAATGGLSRHTEIFLVSRAKPKFSDKRDFKVSSSSQLKALKAYIKQHPIKLLM